MKKVKISQKRKKWLTKRAFFNCITISIGIFIISYIFEIARMAISAELQFPENLMFSVFALFLMAGWIWIMGFLLPDHMDTALTMLGFKEKEDKNDEDKS